MRLAKKMLWISLGLMATCSAGCNKSSNAPSSPTAAGQPAKRYALKGKVVSVDKQAKMATIDAEAMPGFMGAMTMPYRVKPDSELDKLSPGDAITGDLVDEGDTYWVENVVVATHAAGPPPK